MFCFAEMSLHLSHIVCKEECCKNSAEYHHLAYRAHLHVAIVVSHVLLEFINIALTPVSLVLR